MNCEWAGQSACGFDSRGRSFVRPYRVSGRYMKPRRSYLCPAHAEEVARTEIADDLFFNGGNFYRPSNPETWFLTLTPIPFLGEKPEALQ